MERVSEAEGSRADFGLIGVGGGNTHVGGNGGLVSRHADLPATTGDDETSRRATYVAEGLSNLLQPMSDPERRPACAAGSRVTSSDEMFVDIVVDVMPGPALLERLGLKTRAEVCDNLPKCEVVALNRQPQKRKRDKTDRRIERNNKFLLH
eukprot:Selendium_serpulae@DN5925_c3_g2_i1.p1